MIVVKEDVNEYDLKIKLLDMREKFKIVIIIKRCRIIDSIFLNIFPIIGCHRTSYSRITFSRSCKNTLYPSFFSQT